MLSKLFTKLGGTPNFLAMGPEERRDIATSLLKSGRLRQFNDGVHRACGANLLRTALFKIDLTSLDFSGLNLAGANLSCAILDNSDFRNTNLAGASLVGTTISGDVRGANLSQAELQFADLTLAKNLTEVQVKSAQINSKTDLPPAIAAVLGRNSPTLKRKCGP